MEPAERPKPPVPLISQVLLEDGDLRDIVEEFVRGLEGRLAEIKAAHEQLNFDLLTTLAHRLKGAAGSYGYPDMSQLCARMEEQFRAHEADGFATYVAELGAMIAGARAGLDETK